MEDLRYQVDLLNAVNQRLTRDEKMLRLICETATSAFLYVNFQEDYVNTVANWDAYFPDVSIRTRQDIKKLYTEVEDKYILELKRLLFLEETGKQTDSALMRLKNHKTWVECEVCVIYDGETPTDQVIRFKNVSKFQNQNDELMYMAYYDILTGLYNRNYFVKLLADYIRRAEDENAVVAVMFVDIDDFRNINDGFGIVVGDEVVQQFGQFLAGFQNESVIAAHFNADIYCIAIYNPYGSNSVDAIYEEIVHRVENPLILSTGQDINITVSVGVAEYPEAAATTLELINYAEIVMFKAKGAGKSGIQYFTSDILQDFMRSAAIENKLKGALFNQNFMLNFQPQYYAKDKKLRGVEALIRWRDEDGKMISPSVFIPIAERNGKIIPIGSWVVEESIRQFAEWKKNYSGDMILSLNISVIQYKKADFVDFIISMTQKYHVDPHNIELEITESVLIDGFVEVKEKLCVLREYGIRISLDDFGTGYSSLSYLRGLPIDTLKIDKSFVDAMLIDDNAQIIIESIIYMVRRLGFETIAEGVETAEQFEYLKSIECDCIQGFFLGKPQSYEEIEKLLQRS